MIIISNRLHIALVVAIFFEFLLYKSTAFGADFHLTADVESNSNKQQTHIFLEGYIAWGDMKKMQKLIDPLIKLSDDFGDTFDLSLDSPGGDFFEALKIAKYVIHNRIATIIHKDAFCESACALIFLGGEDHQDGYEESNRNFEIGATLGLHAPFPKAGHGIMSDGTRASALIKRTLGNKIPDDVYVDHLLTSPKNFVYLKYVYQAIKWDIQLQGISYEKPTADALLNVCVNLVRMNFDQKIVGLRFRDKELPLTGENGLVINNKKILKDSHDIQITTDEVRGGTLETEKVYWTDPKTHAKIDTNKIRLSLVFDVNVDSDPEARQQLPCVAETDPQLGWLTVNGTPVPQWQSFALGREVNSIPPGPLRTLERPFQGMFVPLSSNRPPTNPPTKH